MPIAFVASKRRMATKTDLRHVLLLDVKEFCFPTSVSFFGGLPYNTLLRHMGTGILQDRRCQATSSRFELCELSQVSRPRSKQAQLSLCFDEGFVSLEKSQISLCRLCLATLCENGIQRKTTYYFNQSTQFLRFNIVQIISRKFGLITA